MTLQKTFGWSPSPPDFRDLKYSAPRGVLAALPERVDLSQTNWPAPWTPAWSQGDLGSCGPHTMGANIVFDQFKRSGAATMPSRLFMYYATRHVMGTINEDSGVYNRDMLKALARFGWPDESLWPYDVRKFKQRPPQAAIDQAAKRAGGIRYLAVPQTAAQMKGCLAEGYPFIFGFMCYESLDTDAVDRSGDIPMPTRNERAIGGHDVLVVGYDDQAKRFLLRNSWGRLWGRGGYGTIPYEYAFDDDLAGDFWTVRDAGYVPEPPAPPPPPPPSGSGTVTLRIYPEPANVEIVK